jgi:hypothetical protein
VGFFGSICCGVVAWMHKFQHEVVASLLCGQVVFNNSIFKILCQEMHNLCKGVGEFVQHCQQRCTTFLKA